MADTPRREHLVVKTEQCAALLRRVVTAWDQDEEHTFKAALAEARQLLGQRATENDLHAGEA